MFYYEVLVGQEYNSAESVFTYSYEVALAPMQFVKVPLQRTQVYGVVLKKVDKPDFKTRLIDTHFDAQLSAAQQHLLHFMTQYYAATQAQALPLFTSSLFGAQSTRSKAASDALLLTPPPSHERRQLPPLTDEQTQAMAVFADHPSETVVLHGDTGTGKTRLYLERALQVLAQQKSILLLCPEISLVPQLYNACAQTLDVPVVVFHSQLTPIQKRAAVAQLKSDNPVVIVGTRSALFLPHPPLGLLILDESHEPAYKQEEGIRFHARTLASRLRQYYNAQLILGSATPSLTDMYIAKHRCAPIIRLTKTALVSDVATTTLVVDMRERSHFGSHSLLSTDLLQTIEHALQRQHQSLIYLNRRGTARLILCQTCGWQADCPHCDITLTYHHDIHLTRCHTCGYTQAAPTQCPECGSSEVIFKSAGTKALADFLQKRFPYAVVARFDTDNLKSESFQTRQQDVASGKIDILVGTQMLVKGHDLPRLEVVGVVSADLSLQIPDYSAEERTYQLINQAIGRVGRGHTSGSIIVQTHQPDNKVIQQALTKNYDAFYTSQTKQRTAYLFPPVIHLASFWCSKKTSAAAEKSATKTLELIRKTSPTSHASQPVVSYRSKKRGYTTMQIVVKNTKRSELLTLAKSMPHGWQYDLEPINLL